MKDTIYKCMVDDEDYEWLSRFRWYARAYKSNSYAYRRVNINKKTCYISMHREIMKLTDRKLEVDHIDHDGLNNQKYNLRICTPQQNRFNSVAKSNSTSKFIGVCSNGVDGKWKARIREIYIGVYKTEEEAAIARDEKAKELFGEFANLNFK